MRHEDAFETPQAGPSRISPRSYAQDVQSEEDEDVEATPKISSKPQLDSAAHSPPPEGNINSHNPTLRLRAILGLNKSAVNTSSIPPSLPTPSDAESEFEIPQVTGTSLARESLSAIFSRALRSPGGTPQKSRDRTRRNSIDASEVEDSPRVLRVSQERARIKGKRQSMSDEEAEKLSAFRHAHTGLQSSRAPASSAGSSEVTFRSAAATFDALRERLQSSVATPRPTAAEQPRPSFPSHKGYSLQQFINSQDMDAMESQSEIDISDGPAEQSGETATLARHMNTMETPNATSASLSLATRTMQMPSQLGMQSNLLDQDSEMQHVMQGADSSFTASSNADPDGDRMRNDPGETQAAASSRADPSTTAAPSVVFPPTRPIAIPNGKSPSSLPFPGASTSSVPAPRFPKKPSEIPSPRVYAKPNSAQAGPSANRVGSADFSTRRLSSGFGRTASRSSSLSAAEFSDRLDEAQRDKRYDRERGWNSPVSKSPGQRGTPPHGQSPSYGNNTTIRGGSPYGPTRRVSSTSVRSSDDGRNSRASSMSSRAEYMDRLKDTEVEKHRNRERLWNRPQNQPRRSSSSMSYNSSGDRPRVSSIPARADSAMSYSTPPRHGERSTSWHSVSSSSPTTAGWQSASQDPKEVYIARERERNWDARHPKWEIQPPREMSPLPDYPVPATSPYSYHGIPKDSPLHPDNRTQRRFVIPSFGSPSPSRQRERRGEELVYERERSQSMIEAPTASARSYRPLARAGTDSKIPRLSASPSQMDQIQQRASKSPTPDKGKGRAVQGAAGFGSRSGWAFPQNRTSSSMQPIESEDNIVDAETEDEEEQLASTSRLPAPGFTSGRSNIPGRASAREMRDRMLRPPSSTTEEEGGTKREHRRSFTEFNEPTGQGRPRMTMDPVEVSTSTEDVPTDGERPPSVISVTESDGTSTASKTPTAVARPAPLPPDSPPHTPPMTPLTSTPRADASEFSDQFYSMNGRPPSPPDTPPDGPEPSYVSELSYTLQTPPRLRNNGSRVEFETPSPVKPLPDLPAPPVLSSSEDEVDEGATPIGNPFANLTNIKTPKPPGGWESTPEPPKNGQQSTGDANRSSAPSGSSQSVVMPTPAPPGAWLPTPAGSLRRRSILKVRFDVDSNAAPADPNTSFESLASVPMVEPNDSISEVFPSVTPVAASKQAAGRGEVRGAEQDRPSTPPTIRARKEPRSPIRLLDAFGREIVEEAEALPEKAEGKQKGKAKAAEGAADSDRRKSSTIVQRRTRPPVRIVDAMGHEITEVSIEDSEAGDVFDAPQSHSEALARVRKTVAGLVEDLGESDTSREIVARDDKRLQDLHQTSVAARDARKGLHEALRKYKGQEAELQAKYGSVSVSMAKNKLLAPAVTVNSRPRTGRFTLNFANGWILVVLFILQIFYFTYMFHWSTIRAKRLFLRTYYDSFNPDLFLHLTTHHAIPDTSNWTLAAVQSSLHNLGWRGLLTEVWGNVTTVVADVRNNVWDTWGQRRTIPWPPT